MGRLHLALMLSCARTSCLWLYSVSCECDSARPSARVVQHYYLSTALASTLRFANYPFHFSNNEALQRSCDPGVTQRMLRITTPLHHSSLSRHACQAREFVLRGDPKVLVIVGRERCARRCLRNFGGGGGGGPAGVGRGLEFRNRSRSCVRRWLRLQSVASSRKEYCCS